MKEQQRLVTFHLFSSRLTFPKSKSKEKNYDRKQVFKTTWGGRPLVEIGQLAKQANGAVLVRYGDTVV